MGSASFEDHGTQLSFFKRYLLLNGAIFLFTNVFLPGGLVEMYAPVPLSGGSGDLSKRSTISLNQ
jgi:hypothetical protein